MLWTSFLDGDKDALGMIYTNCYNLLYNYGLKICNADAMVKDCIQDLFIKLYNNRELKNINYVEAFLLHSLRNMIFDALTQSTKEQASDIDALFDMVVDDSELKELFKDDDEYLQKVKSLADAYTSLIPNQKQSLYLRFIKGMTYKEISIVLNIHEQSAMNLVSRSLSSVRRRINK